MNSHKDMFRRDLAVGDFIVYSALDGRSGVLRAGKVVALAERDVNRVECVPTIKVKAAEWCLWQQKPQALSKVITLAMLNRIVVVPSPYLPISWVDAIEAVPGD